MLARTFFVLLLIQIFHSIQTERVLFDQAFIKFVRYGKRQVYHNVTFIDDKIVPNDKHLIIVKSKTMEVLYPEAIRNLKNIQDLFLTNCGIKIIEPTAFFNLPNLSVIHLQDNLIKEVKKGVFTGLPIKILSLHRNEIKIIDSEAFDDMPNLYKIKLNSNRLKSWDAGWFKSAPKLTEIYFRRNRINFLPPSAFANIKGSHLVDGEMVLNTKIFLSKNKLGDINPESFYNLDKISQLYLDRNGIQEIPNGAFRDLVEIHLIYLSRNKITKVGKKSFPQVKSIGILELSSNLLNCVPYELVTVSNVTNLEKNNGTCDCIREFKAKLKKEKRKSEISYDEESCPE